MGIQHGHHRPWDSEEDDFIRDTVGEPVAVIAEVLGRSSYSVHARRMWLFKPGFAESKAAYSATRNEASRDGATQYRTPWTAEEDDLVLATLDEPLPDVAEVLNRTINGVARRRYSLRARTVATGRRIEAAGRANELRRTPADYGTRCDRCTLVHRGEC